MMILGNCQIFPTPAAFDRPGTAGNRRHVTKNRVKPPPPGASEQAETDKP
jgi:hypothetical protein